jgi:hypothetical protein
VPIGEGDRQGNLRRGQGRVLVPAEARPSFSAGNTKLRWVIKVHGHIDRWPDLNEEFAVGVLPAAKLTASAREG